MLRGLFQIGKRIWVNYDPELEKRLKTPEPDTMAKRTLEALSNLTIDDLYVYQGETDEAFKTLGTIWHIQHLRDRIAALVEQFDEGVCDYYEIIQATMKPRRKRSYRSLKGKQAACRRQLNAISAKISDLQATHDDLLAEVMSAEPRLLHREEEQQ